MKKTASYKSLVSSLEGFLGKDGSSVKAAEEQGSTESAAPNVTATDPEVKDILPPGSHERGSTPTNDIAGQVGVPTGTPVPGQPSPSTEEPKKEETSPESKVASLGGVERVDKGNDKFASILAELRGEEVVVPATSKTASEATTPSDAKSDPEIADLSGNGNGGAVPKNTEDTSGNPPSQEGAGSNSEPGCSMKEAGLSDEDIATLTNKVARFIEDQQYASAVAGQLIENTFGVRMSGQKTAGVATSQPTEQQKLAYAQLETRVNAKVAELAAQGLTRDQIAWHIQKIAMDEGAALVEGPAPEEAAAAQGGGEPQVSPEEIVVVLEQLVQAGEISPEEAVQAAQVIDEQLNGEGGGMPAPDTGGGMPPEMAGGAPPAEGGGAPPAEGGGAPPAEGGGESEEDDDDDEDEEEPEPSDKKEAALKKAEREYNRGLEIASLINQKIAENRGGPKMASLAVRKSSKKLRNTKIALLKKQNATDESVATFMTTMENRKRAGARVSQSDSPSIQDAFLAVDTLVDRGHITAKKAAYALELLHSKGDASQISAIIKTAQALDVFQKAAGAEPMPAGPEGGAPPAGPEGGSPAGDPTAAIDQLLGALEQLVMAGVIPEEKAVEMVQGLGIAPPPGPEGAAGGAPMPPAGPAAPVPGGAPAGPPMA
jgi:hypothetical protein